MKKLGDVSAVAARLGSEDTVDKMEVNGALLPYAAEGQGPTVVFLHGALIDYRMWNRHRSAMADRYRAVSYTQRYFGPLPWEKDWPPFFSVVSHAAARCIPACRHMIIPGANHIRGASRSAGLI